MEQVRAKGGSDQPTVVSRGSQSKLLHAHEGRGRVYGYGYAPGGPPACLGHGASREHSLVVVVLSANDVDVQRDSGTLRERLEHVRDHLGGQVTNLFPFQLQVAAEVRTGRDVQNGSRQGLPCV